MAEADNINFADPKNRLMFGPALLSNSRTMATIIIRDFPGYKDWYVSREPQKLLIIANQLLELGERCNLAGETRDQINILLAYRQFEEQAEIPLNARVVLELGMAFGGTAEKGKAIDYLEQALSLSPQEDLEYLRLVCFNLTNAYYEAYEKSIKITAAKEAYESALVCIYKARIIFRWHIDADTLTEEQVRNFKVFIEEMRTEVEYRYDNYRGGGIGDDPSEEPVPN
ncbi:MAG TPA: hypothetical protein ENI23_14140 [bacterium]|nr:hypothetical protein [bacterium]